MDSIVQCNLFIYICASVASLIFYEFLTAVKIIEQNVRDLCHCSRAEITVGHHCGGDIFQNIFSEKCENVLKNLSSTVMTGSYFPSML